MILNFQTDQHDLDSNKNEYQTTLEGHFGCKRQVKLINFPEFDQKLLSEFYQKLHPKRYSKIK